MENLTIYIKAFTIFILCNVIGGSRSQSNDIANKDTLQLVQVIIRHGDRAPIRPYPNDLYKNQSVYWPNGWAQLTQIGLQQQLELGQYLRQRYDGFLPSKYSRHDILVESSNADRAIQSAEANLGGLYHLAKATLVSGIESEWQAVPIHTIPTEIDIYINNEVLCPRYTTLLDEVYSNLELTQLNRENAEFIQFVSEKSGVVGVSKVNQLGQVQDALRSEKSHNLPLPDWATDEVIERLNKFKALTFQWKVQTKEMKRLQAGPMVGKLMDNFMTKAKAPLNLDPEDSPFQNENPFRKMYFFSGHDTTFGAVMGTWGIFNSRIPPYAACLMMELHRKSKSSEPYVEIYYRNESKHEPFPLEIPGCGSPCYLSKLQLISNEYIPTDWDEECIAEPISIGKTGRLSLSAVAPGGNSLMEEGDNAGPGISIPGLLTFAGGVVLIGGLIGATLFSVKGFQDGRSRFVQPPFGVNSYQTLA